MRFSTTNPSFPEQGLRLLEAAWCLSKSTFKVVGICLLSVCFSLASRVEAQGPGTEPPPEIFSDRDSPGDGESPSGIPIRAFMFQSEAQSSVVMPEMTWEELDRLQSLEAGAQLPSQSFSYQDLGIVGNVAGRRAELEVTLGLSIESTNNKWIAIPLKMGNFHRLAPPDVTGVEEYRMTLSAEGGGYLLWVKTKNRRDATMRMRVSARVENASTRSLEFKLPDVPSTVELTVDQSNVIGDVIERGYETVETKEVAGGRTRFTVESTGGSFTLQWGQLERKVDDAPMLEVTSRINVTWDSPQDAPRVAVQLFLNNVRTSIGAIEIRLPTGAIVSEDASLGVGGKTVQFGTPVSDASGEVRRIQIPELERKTRIDLNFSFVAPLPAGGASAKSPLAFRVPEVTGALRHRGDITIRTNDDYRLRWAAKPWVRSVLGESADEAAAGRSYLFEFDRGTFELPLWLSAKERQVRVNASSRISFRESIATLEMLIRSSDRAADGRGPQLDMADWSLQSIENAETGEPIDIYEGEGFPEIDVPDGSGEPPTIRVMAQYAIEPTEDLIKIKLPRIVKTEGGLLTPTSTLDVVSTGRTFFLVNLEASERLERLAGPASDAGESTVNSYRVHSHKAPAVLAGTIDPQPPRITLATDGSILLDGNQLHTTIDWDVTSPLDLEGVLPIRLPRGIPGPAPPRVSDPPAAGGGLLENAINLFSGDPLNTPALKTDGWTVTVNGTSARLNPIDEDRFNLISPELGVGNITISWRRTQQLSLDSIGESIESVALPRPAIDNVTLTDVVRISLKGNHQTELSSALSPSVNELVLDSLPPEPIRLRLRSRETPREELSVSQAVLRSAIGRKTRHEQILAVVQGGESFKVDLPNGLNDVNVEAFIDGKAEPVLRDEDTLILSLRGDQSSHVVDLRIYAPEPAQSSVERIEPLLRLPVGVGRVYWQIVSPWDSHVLWASPTMGRSMTWNFSDWRLGRRASHDDPALTGMIGAQPHAMPPGNRYLYIGSDVRSFQVVAVSRVVLWLIVGSIVLLAAVALIYFPRTRHPLSAIVAAVLFAGLLAVAPDTAVLAGQLGIIALALVIVMIAVRALVSPAGSDRIIKSRDARRAEASTRSLKKPATQERRSSVTQTQALPPSPTEASS